MLDSPISHRPWRFAAHSCVAMASLVVLSTAFALKGTTPDESIDVPALSQPVANSLPANEAKPDVSKPDDTSGVESLDPIISWQSVSDDLNEPDDAPDYVDVIEGYVIVDIKSRASRPDVHRIHSRKARARLGERLRKEYPYVSLESRLARFRRTPSPPEQVQLDRFIEIPLELDEVEPWLLRELPRMNALQMLHSERVSDFIEAQGFGHTRMPFMPEEVIVQQEIEAMPAIPPFQSQSFRSARTVELSLENFDGTNASLMPSLDDLHVLQLKNQNEFASFRSFGHVKNLHRVAGFLPHSIQYLHKIGYLFDEDRDRTSWQVSRLQLVSLLLHDEPAVYVSKSLPRMSELAERPVTRELDDFEQAALAELEAGENVVYRATLNHIEMVGAIRAVNQCLQCHQVERGALLGAFSYSLFRDPPVDVANDEAISAR